MQVGLGRPFAWLWGAFAVSTVGMWVAFDAFPLIAILALHVGPAAVSALASVGLAAGALAAAPLGPWLEYRAKRPVMIAMDLIRFVAVASVPAAYLMGRLSFVQLLAVSAVVAAADIVFRSASGAFLKGLVPPKALLVTNGRFEATTWTAIALGPPLGGLAIGVFGPVVTAGANAVSFLLSALGLCVIGRGETPPARPAGASFKARALLEGWRFILAHPVLRPLFLNTLLVNGLIMATAPLLAVLMLGRLGFSPWQYGLAFGAPCVGGLIGARLARPLVARLGQRRVLLIAGALRACWSIGLALIGRGVGGLALVIVLQLGLVTCVGLFNPVFASFQLEQTPTDRIARTLSAWSVSSKLATAALTALWGLLASLIGLRAAIAAAGLVLLASPLLLRFSSSDQNETCERNAKAS